MLTLKVAKTFEADMGVYASVVPVAVGVGVEVDVAGDVQSVTRVHGNEITRSNLHHDAVLVESKHEIGGVCLQAFGSVQADFNLSGYD